MSKSILETVEGKDKSKLLFTDSRKVSASLGNKGNETDRTWVMKGKSHDF